MSQETNSVTAAASGPTSGPATGRASATPPAGRPTGAPSRWQRYLVRDEMGVVLVLVALVVAVGLAHPEFWNSGNLLSTAQTSS